MKKVLVFGGSGLVGSKFIELTGQSFDIKAPLVTEVDILNKDQISRLIQGFKPDFVINFAAYTNVEEAEKQKGDKSGICYLINSMGAKNVAEVCKQNDVRLIHISTEYIFDGSKADSPYTEDDKPNPINWYGQTKHYAEEFVLGSECLATIARICMPFSAFYQLKKDIARFFLQELDVKREIKAIADQKITPTLVDDISRALELLINNPTAGIYHICVQGFTTPYDFAKSLAKEFNLDISLIKPILFEEYSRNKNAKLLKSSWLDSTKFRQDFKDDILHSIETSLQIFKQQIVSK